MAQDYRFWVNVNRIFHRATFLYYVRGEAFPTVSAQQATNSYVINSGTATGGKARVSAKTVYLSGGASGVPGKANVKLGGTLLAGSRLAAIFPGIPVTVDGVSSIEEIEVQFEIQSGTADNTAAIAALVVGILQAISAGTNATNCLVRCSNLDANSAQIATGLQTKYNATDPDAGGTEEIAATASTGTLTITAKTSLGAAANTYEFGFEVLDKPPSQLSFIPGSPGVPALAGIYQFGSTRAFKGQFGSGTAAIQADQQLADLTNFPNSQTAACSFEMLQDADPRMLETVGGTIKKTNTATADILMPAGKSFQTTYSLIMTTPSALIENAYDYLWIYRGKSSQLDLSFDLRQNTPVNVNFTADLFPGRVDLVGHYGIVFAM